MTAIPADIQKAAERVYAQLGRGPDADEQAIAKALRAERERCLGECRRYRMRFVSMPSSAAKTSGDNASLIIEDAIRNPSTGA